MIWHLILKPIWRALFGNRWDRQRDVSWQEANDQRREPELKPWPTTPVDDDDPDGWLKHRRIMNRG